jgi:hypothetical protein
VDLVDEQHVAGFEAGEDGGEVPGAFDGWPGGGAELRTDLGRDDGRQRGLAEPRGTREQDVVGGLAAVAGTGQHQLELTAHPLLADELLQARRPEAGFEPVLADQGAGVEQVVVGRHARAPSKAAAPRCRRQRRSSSEVGASIPPSETTAPSACWTSPAE